MFVFKCKWIYCNTGVHVDDLSFTLVDLTKVTYKEDHSPWINKKKRFLCEIFF